MSNGHTYWIFARMDSQSRPFETPLEMLTIPAATPLPCPHPMRPQSITVWTPTRILGTALMALLTVPRILAVTPAVTRRRRA